MDTATESQQQQQQQQQEDGTTAPMEVDSPGRLRDSQVGEPTETKKRFTSLTEIAPKASECYHCLKCWGYCEVHDKQLKKELANYFSGPFHGETEYGERLVYWARERFRRQHPRESSPPLTKHAQLGSRLVGFCENFSDCRYEEQDLAVLEHGKMGVTFDASSFDMGCDPYLRDNYGLIQLGNTYFNMGVIFSVAPCGDMFCCLFEDGKYYFCDYDDTCKSGPKEVSYAWKLQHLKEVIEANKTNVGAAAS